MRNAAMALPLTAKFAAGRFCGRHLCCHSHEVWRGMDGNTLTFKSVVIQHSRCEGPVLENVG